MSFKKALNAINKVGAIAKDVEAVASGDTKKISTRAKNKVKNKALMKLNFWKW